MKQGEMAEIKELASVVRDVADRRFYRHRRLRNCCLVVSYSLMKLCIDSGYSVALVGGWYRFKREIPPLKFGDPSPKSIPLREDEPHCWLKVDNKYLDLTLTQFEADAPRVAVVDPDDWRYVPRTVQETCDMARFDLSFMGRLEDAEALAFEVEMVRRMKERA